MKLRPTALLASLCLLLITSCAPETFKAVKKQDKQTTNPVQITSASTCAAFTLVKPKVDFLFLWDNSTSSVFINDQTKAALNNTINEVSSQFDYHIMLAPLIGTGNNYAKFISDGAVQGGSTPDQIKIDRYLAAQSLNFPAAQGSAEEGATRAYDLIRNNISTATGSSVPNGIFRPNSYLIVVVMSNEDDNKWVTGAFPIAQDRVNYIKEMENKLLCLRGNYNRPAGAANCTGVALNSSMMRFISVVAQNPTTSSCPGVALWKQNTVYKEMSEYIYNYPYNNGISNPSDQAGQVTPDSVNICGANLSTIFDGINNAITQTLIKHKYNYWPVATSGASAIDPNEISVVKDGVSLSRLTTPVSQGANGFTFDNFVQTQNTRFSPDPGEPFTGYLVQLHGSGIVEFPSCISVTTQTPKDFYGYVQLATKPLEGTIVLKINGQTVPQSATNGWQLIKSGGQPLYSASRNIKITGAGDFCPSNSTNYCAGSPADNKSGYFLQVFGTAVYSNGATIEATYDPSL